MFFVGRDKYFGWINNFPQALITHFENTNFRGGSEPVFIGSQNPVNMLVISFELENNIDNMFQCFWSGKVSFLCNMANQNDGGICAFCKAQQCRSTFPYLRNTTRRRFKILSGNCLDGIDNYNVRLLTLTVTKDIIQGCFVCKV